MDIVTEHSENGTELFVGHNQYLVMICTLTGADLGVGHCRWSSLRLILVDSVMNELCCVPMDIKKEVLLGEGDQI